MATYARPGWTSRLLFALTLAALSSCADPSHVVGLEISTSFPLKVSYGSFGLSALAIYSDGRMEWVSTAAEWASSDTSVASITMGPWQAEGTCVSPGETVVTASYQDVSASVVLTISP